MIRIFIFLFFFTLSAMAQSDQNRLEKEKSPKGVADTKIILGYPSDILKYYPLIMLMEKDIKQENLKKI